jgi:Leucine-rich repeat (LRR) protein
LLTLLNLGYNNLQLFPPGLSSLTSLKHLYVNNNYIEVVPVEVVQMEKLGPLNIQQNPISQPPMETCERGLGAMKR